MKRIDRTSFQRTVVKLSPKASCIAKDERVKAVGRKVLLGDLTNPIGSNIAKRG